MVVQRCHVSKPRSVSVSKNWVQFSWILFNLIFRAGNTAHIFSIRTGWAGTGCATFARCVIWLENKMPKIVIIMQYIKLLCICLYNSNLIVSLWSNYGSSNGLDVLFLKLVSWFWLSATWPYYWKHYNWA